MKISKVLHVLSVISGVIGLFAFLGTWGGGMYGMMGGAYNNMMTNSPIIYFLIAIWLQLGTMHHIMLEKKGEIV